MYFEPMGAMVLHNSKVFLPLNFLPDLGQEDSGYSVFLYRKAQPPCLIKCTCLPLSVMLCCHSNYHVTLLEARVPKPSGGPILQCVSVYSSDSIILHTQLR